MKTIKKWQEPFYAIGGFGPGFLYQVVLTYLLYYYRPAQARVEAGALIFAPGSGGVDLRPGSRLRPGDADRPHPGWGGGPSHRLLDG